MTMNKLSPVSPIVRKNVFGPTGDPGHENPTKLDSGDKKHASWGVSLRNAAKVLTSLKK
jgi:hypothetical protein